MEEEKPAQLPVSEQEVQIQTPSFLDKINPPAGGHKFKILAGILGILGVLVFVGAVFGAYKFGQKQGQIVPRPTPTPLVTCGPCPQFTPPHPDFCKDGTIIPGEKNECGCQMPPRCQKISESKVFCQEPRPEVCTLEQVMPPTYICGSDGRSHGNKCQACADPKVEWYIIQDNPCEEEFCGGIAGTECPSGYRCQLEGNYPDAGGRCIKE